MFSVDHVDGGSLTGTAVAGEEVRFHIRATNSGTSSVTHFTNGFGGYSPDGAEWEPVEAQLVGEWTDGFDLFVFVDSLGVDGVGEDTVSFRGYAFLGSGFYSGFDSVVWSLKTQVDTAFVGRTLCIDSSYFPPQGLWWWATFEIVECEPAWDGPHCFEISAPIVYAGIRGNTDGDASDLVNISDMTYLVAYLFSNGSVPPCFEEADVAADRAINISDMTYLVGYLFTGGQAPADCPDYGRRRW